jgi:GTP-binding protein Era
MTEPFRAGVVAVVGRPNAGKSTLVNRLVGEKVAIVSSRPQTTRKRILGIVERPGLQIALVDTPGIHRPEHRMNAVMVRDALDAMEACDVILFVADASEERGPGERYIAEGIARTRIPAVVALNKIDRVSKPRLLPVLESLSRMGDFAALVPVSARTGDGTEELLDVLARLVPESARLFPIGEPAPGPLSEKIAEQIREPALERTRQEVPFALAVVVDEVRREAEADLTFVRAALVVEREGQKAILVGKRGAMIRAIGTAARRACEERFGGRFYLDLRVEARESWREDDRFLARIVNPEV